MTANDVAINNSLRLKNTVENITNCLEKNDLESAENWARHLEMQLSSFRLALAFEIANQNAKVGA